MKFAIDELNWDLFHAETQLNSVEHPHVYLQWMHIKMTEKLLNEIKQLNVALDKKMNN